MRTKEFKKQFKDEYQIAYNHNLTLKDIFQNNELKPKKRFNINNYWKYSSICSTCLLIISLVFIGIIFINGVNPINELGEHNFEIINFTEDNNILTEEEIYEFKTVCDGGFYKDTAKYLKIDDEITMYVYVGLKSISNGNGLEYQNIYFYVFDFTNSNRNMIIDVNDQEIVVNKDNRSGILNSLESNEKQEILFTLTYSGESNKYLYKAE